MRVHHDLKLLPRFFQAKEHGLKPWEVRSTDDRTFKTGDMVTFKEVDAFHLEPTGRTYGPVEITYIIEGQDGRGLIRPETCIFTHTSVSR